MLLLLSSHLIEGEKTLAFLPSQIPQEEGLLIPLLVLETSKKKRLSSTTVLFIHISDFKKHTHIST